MLLFALSLLNAPEDKSKLSKIYDLYFTLMYNYAISTLKTKSEAEDAVQETFLSLAMNIKKIDDPTSLASAGYVMTTLKNKIIDIKRKKKRDMNIFESIVHKHIEFDDSVIDLLIKSEQKERLAKAVETLKSRDRHILLMRLYEERSFEDIAKLTGISEGNVKNVYYRALEKLRKILEDKEDE